LKETGELTIARTTPLGRFLPDLPIRSDRYRDDEGKQGSLAWPEGKTGNRSGIEIDPVSRIALTEPGNTLRIKLCFK